MSFDFNYRSKLWSPEESRKGCHPFAAAADIVFAPIRDAQTHYGLPEEITPEEALAALRQAFPQATVILTLGADGFNSGRTGAGPDSSADLSRGRNDRAHRRGRCFHGGRPYTVTCTMTERTGWPTH